MKSLSYFPSLHSTEPKFIKIFKFVFEVLAKILVNWWALIIIWFGTKLKLNFVVTSIKQIPNGLGWARIVLSPYITWQLVQSSIHQQNNSFWLAAMIVIIALDALDGPIARDLDAISEFGKRLDPAADKLCFALLLLGYCVASLYEYNFALFVMLVGFAAWCLHVEIKLIRLATGPFRKLLKLFPVEDPGAFIYGKIKFNLQMIACIGGWIGILYRPQNPAGIVFTILTLMIARRFGDKSLGWHRQEYMFIYSMYLWNRYFSIRSSSSDNNVIPIRKTA